MSAARVTAAWYPSRSAVLTFVLGLMIGLGILGAFVITPAPLNAETVDRTEKFVIFSAQMATGTVGEGVFVLDSVNGKLYGGSIGSNGRFTSSYGRDIAADFGDRQGNADYAVSTGRNQSGGGMIYIAENRSGTLVAYGIPNGQGQAMPLVPTDKFQFRQAIQ